MKYFFLLLFFVFPFSTYAQNAVQVRICTYNVLNVGDNDYDRAGAFRTVLDGVRPDVLVCQEINNEAGIRMLLDSALNFGFEPTYRAAPFQDGPDTDNALFYNANVIEFIEANYYPTALRDIAEYVLLPKGTDDTLVIFSAHLKAGDDSASEAQRVEEAKVIRSLMESVGESRKFIVAGDLNVYSAAEMAYEWLTNPSIGMKSVRVQDPIDMYGAWHSNEDFAANHTQSTRSRRFGGGLEGGLDDRFDFILISAGLSFPTYQDGSYTAFGNDGNHFNDSINAMPNAAVPPEVAQALHDASDHLPVYLDLRFESVVSSIRAEIVFDGLPLGIW